LDNALQAMANVTERIDDVDNADKRSDNDKYLNRPQGMPTRLWTICWQRLDKSATLQSRLPRTKLMT
jgi:hypothetical protein